MPATINLIKHKKKSLQKKKIVSKDKITIGSIIFFLFIVFSITGSYAYRIVLEKQSKLYDIAIQKQKEIISSYKSIEDRKSILTLKTNELEKIYKNRFDYLKAIDDARTLFGYSIDIESISLNKSGSVSITARKVSDITLSQEQAFSTNIKELKLTLTVATSKELEDTIDTLLSFEGKGLSHVVINSTKLNKDGEYEANFTITFHNVDINSPALPNI